MLLRIVYETWRRRKRRVGTAVLAVLVGAALATALFTVSTEVNDKIARELRAYGANILVTAKNAGVQVEIGGVSYKPVVAEELLDEGTLARLKTIFWRHNIVGFAPYLNVPVTFENDPQTIALAGTWFEKELRVPAGATIVSGSGQSEKAAEEIVFRTGVKSISPWWKLRGNWVADGDAEGSIVGSALAARRRLEIGDYYTVTAAGRRHNLRVAGIVSSGGFEEEQIFIDLPLAQRIAGVSSGVSRVLVSALTEPKEKLPADIRDKRPEDMTPKEYEKWYCSPIVEAVIQQITEVIPASEARAVRQFSDQEGAFSMKIQLLLVLVTVVALLASALGVMATMTTLVLERRTEIGLMKAIGADGAQVAMIFLAEAVLIGLLGGAIGFAVGGVLARFIGERVFDAQLVPGITILPVTLILAIVLAVAGSLLPVRRAVQLDPIALLRG